MVIGTILSVPYISACALWKIDITQAHLWHDCNQVHIVAIVLVTTGRGGRTRSHDGDY